MRVFAGPAVRMSNDGAGALQDDDRPPLPGRLAGRAWAVRVDRLRRLAGQPRQLARVRRQHAPGAELAFRAGRVGERVEAVGVDDQRGMRVQGEVDHQAPGGAVAAEARADDPDFGRLELAQDRVVGGVPDGAGRDLRHRRRHDLGAFGGEDGVDGGRHQEPDEAGAGARRGSGREVRRSGQAEAARQDDCGAEGALVGVLGAGGDEYRVGGRQHRSHVRDLEVGGRHREAAVVGDADLELGAPVIAQEPGAGGAVGSGEDLDPPAGEADAGPVEALDHRLFRGPAAGQALVVAVAVGQLGRGVDLGQEAGAGPPYGQGDPVD